MRSEVRGQLPGNVSPATADELAAIDEGLASEAVSDEEVEAAFASFRRDRSTP
jgi:hypothetical protein